MPIYGRGCADSLRRARGAARGPPPALSWTDSARPTVMPDPNAVPPPSTGRPFTAADLVAAAQARVRALTPAETADAVAAGAVLLDVREREELEYEGVIAGAVHVPRGVL